MTIEVGQQATVLENQDDLLDEIQAAVYPPLDLYIMIPCVLDKKYSIEASVSDVTGSTNHFLKSIADVAAYEMEKGLSSKLSRMMLGRITVVCLTDDVKEKEELGRQTINVYLTKHEETALACITLVFPDLELPVTNLLDQMSRNEILITTQANKMYLMEWLNREYGIVSMGMSRSFTNLSSKVSEQDLMYLLANEVNGSRMMKHKLTGDNFKEAAKTNIAQFDLSEIYIHEGSIVQVYKTYKDTYYERIEDHVLTLFIMELILMQDAAIARVSDRVSKELDNKSNISLKFIEEINLDFSKTMFLWNLNNFKYSVTQAVVDAFIKAFKIQEKLEVYKTNKGFLEDLITVYTARSTERNNKILNIGIVFLTISQVLPIYYDISKKMVKGDITNFDIWFGISTLGISILILYLVRMFTKRR